MNSSPPLYCMSLPLVKARFILFMAGLSAGLDGPASRSPHGPDAQPAKVRLAIAALGQYLRSLPGVEY